MTGQFFNRLDGALDYQLNEKIIKEDKGYDSSSGSSSTTSLAGETTG